MPGREMRLHLESANGESYGTVYLMLTWTTPRRRRRYVGIPLRSMCVPIGVDFVDLIVEPDNFFCMDMGSIYGRAQKLLCIGVRLSSEVVLTRNAILQTDGRMQILPLSIGILDRDTVEQFFSESTRIPFDGSIMTHLMLNPVDFVTGVLRGNTD